MPGDHEAAALSRLLSDYTFQTVLDLGGGRGGHAARLRSAGKTVVTLDAAGGPPAPGADIGEPLEAVAFADPFDAIWCWHVLDRQRDVHAFLLLLFDLLKPGGVLVLTVPPPRPTLAAGRLNGWNAGQLLHRLVLAGFDARRARLHTSAEGEVSVILRKRRARLPRLATETGELEALAPFFPSPVAEGCDGAFGDIRWTDEAPDWRAVPGAALSAEELTIDLFRALPAHETDEASLRFSAQCVSLPGAVAEFGVYKGRSLRVLAQELPDYEVRGFDSFRGLPESWVRSDRSTYGAGHFSDTNLLAARDLPANVRLVPGFFQDSLPVWRPALEAPMALLHIDCDLYSSTRQVLALLDGHIAPGTVLVFDELCDWAEAGVYPKWEEGEWRALREWMAMGVGRRVRLLSRGPRFSASVVVA
jgi:SAM-dependent methyltransferase